jgi:rhodanese-related sulfurtransferase
MSRRTKHASSKPSKATDRARRKARATRKNWIWIGAAVLGVVVVLVLLLRPGTRVPAEITASQAFEKYQHGAFFLDVRSEEEWNAGHVPGSVAIPLDELAGRLGELPKDREIVVVCALGLRSTEGAKILVEAGFWPVGCLRGGLQAWSAAGYPLQGDGP